jgi:predicted enzyme related to lactoylglutathione lyase
MKPGMQLVVYPVKDIARAKTLYRELLGVEPYVDQPYYVGFRTGDQEIGLDPKGHAKGMIGPIGYVDVTDIHGRLQSLVEAGARKRQGVTDVGGGMLIAWLEDADGNLIGLRQTPG